MYHLEIEMPGEGTVIKAFRTKSGALRSAERIWMNYDESDVDEMDRPSPTPTRLMKDGATILDADELWIAIL